MPGPVVHLGATVLCSHAGQATPTTPFARVLVNGLPVVTVTTPYVVAACGLTGSTVPPCTVGQWLSGATRVLAGGLPVAVQGGASTCVPTGTPMLPVAVQPRVVAT